MLATGQTLDAQAWTQPEILLAVNRVIDREAFMLAANDVFTASAVLFVLLALVIWWARPEPAVAH